MRLLLLAAGVVLVVFGAMAVGFYACLSSHPSARIAGDSGETDAAPLPLPEDPGTVCQRKAVALVRTHPGAGAETVAAAAKARLGEVARAREQKLRLIGWRGREDHSQHHLCRVSLRYMLGQERGASVWLVDPEAPASARLEPQDTLSVEVTGRVPFDDAEAERRLRRKCSTKGIEDVQRHFSYMEEYGIWAAMRKREVRERQERGTEIAWGDWSARPEGPDRCLVMLDYTEDGEPKTEVWRLRWLPNDELAVEPLTPRAIESIYGPGVYSR